MSNTGITLDNEERKLFLVLGADSQNPSHWSAMVAEGEGVSVPLPIRGNQEPKKIAEDIRNSLYSHCSSSWLDNEFGETKKAIIALVDEVRGFACLIAELHLSDEQARDMFLDVSRGLRIEIQAAMFRFFQRRRPAAADLVRKALLTVDTFDVPEWMEPVPAGGE